MKRYAGVVLLIVMLSGCAGYKELQPDPELIPAERGYIELKHGKDNFELKQGKKYLLKVPAPPDDHFFFLLVTPSKRAIYSTFSSSFDNGAGPAIPDEAKSSDSISAFAVNKSVPMFFWVIDTVRSDFLMSLHVRYVPVWRYTFENMYNEYQQILSENTVDRATYNSINLDYDVDGIDFAREIPMVGGRTAKINAMHDQMLHLESVFPPNIASSRDTAYQQYVAFKSRVDDELSFQGNYLALLNLFKTEKDTRGNTPAFLDSAGYFAGVLKDPGRFPPAAMERVSHVLLRRLSDASRYLESGVQLKSDISRFADVPSVADLTTLYKECGGQIPPETERVIGFMSLFNTAADSLRAANAKYEALKNYFDAHTGTASESYCAELTGMAAGVRAAVPDPHAIGLDRYGSYNCAATLSRSITYSSNQADDLKAVYQSAGTVAGQTASKSWASSEPELRRLFEWQGTSNSPEVTRERSQLVTVLEVGIYDGVKTASEARVDGFITTHEGEYDKVAQLYADSAFRPVYDLSFSSTGPGGLAAKKKVIQDYLDQIKYIRFPEASIKNIYQEFTRNMADHGVEKARAIVKHGGFYKGTDKQIKGIVAECDPDIPKVITKPKEYRKLFAFPVSDNGDATNDYLFRIQLKIPSEAQFPVFDMNLKLPQEIAGKSTTRQWYESITIDKKPIKNEGRFRITSPTVENNYEAQITPVQMDKEGRNILEIRFKSPGFRVFEVSAMAQVPIIRKN